EQYRDATRTTHEDILQPGAGAPALIQSGGAMFVQVDRLYNHYADILAGGDQIIVGLPPHPPKETDDDPPKYNKAALIDNLTAELWRTEDFNNVSYTYDGTPERWTMPSQTYKIAQIGGRITSGGAQYIVAVDVNNHSQTLSSSGSATHSAPVDLNTNRLASLDNSSLPDAHLPSGDTPESLHAPSQPLYTLVDTLPPDIIKDNAPITVATPSSVTAAAAPGSLTLPNNSLFTVHPDAARLITTDPRFTAGRDLTSADRQLQALGDLMTTTHKRLGDGYYEQRLIREQIAQLTGRRFLDGHSSDDEQYRALLDAGVTVAQRYGLRSGIALSADQVSQLTSDIVWLVEQDVQLPGGTTTRALVPRVYLRPRTGDLEMNGALLAGASLTMDVSGTLAGGDHLKIDADTIHQDGGHLDGDQLDVHVKGTFTDIGGTFSARDSMNVKADRGFVARSTTRRYTTEGQRHFSRTEVDRESTFRVTGPGGTLHLESGQDMTLQGVNISNTGAGGTVDVKAAGNIHMGTVAVGETGTALLGARNSRHSTRDSEAGTRITSTGNITIQGDGGVTGRAVTLDSREGDLDISAAHGRVLLLSGQERRTSQEERYSRPRGLFNSSSRHNTASSEDTIALGSVLGGNHIRIKGEKVYSVGTELISDTKLDIEGTYGVRMEAAENTHTSSYSTEQRRSGFSRSGVGFTVGSQKSSEQGHRQVTYHTGNTMAALNGNIRIHSSQGNVETPGSNLIAAGGIDVSGVNVDLGDVRDTAAA
ncbi:MAG TPA: hemagglutinin repeat-containing protein, partial [Xylella sp.]